jgi:uncharacterized repeat protein (TIGR03803 family)
MTTFLKPTLVALALGAAAGAQAGGTLSAGYAFPNTTDAASSGIWPEWELSTADGSGYMWGTTTRGGTNAGGAIYKTNNAGSVVHVYTFGATGSSAGSQPNGPLLVIGNDHYGLAAAGGTGGKGVLYDWNATSAYQAMHSFTGTDGDEPSGPLTKATDGNFYGTTVYGGACNLGVVFKYVPSTHAVSVLHSFCGTEGSSPRTGVIQARDGNLYGTTNLGGTHGYGTLFRLSLAGAFTQMRSFGATRTEPIYPGRLMQASDSKLYGTSYRGGYDLDISAQPGTVFSMTTSGVLSTSSFEWVGMSGPWYNAALIERFTGVLYGVTAANDYGHVFQYRMSNATITNVIAFNSRTVGWPYSGLTLGPDGNLWGTTTDGEMPTGPSFGHLYRVVNLTANP